jgi:hypothetical protein
VGIARGLSSENLAANITREPSPLIDLARTGRPSDDGGDGASSGRTSEEKVGSQS